ncbi:MCE family protein [Haloechinothrix sp. LS1_15]|uniref:MCE family protein n=1 Tax=Haloechinothrix sp. LS1_15 TaxID=2652248 RepID=UPI00294427D4|nr:MCE family protein [Haloechinothrix sp. LS1_15]MDV6014320.1 MCE family protein [Haloechinothrix sp. LS1_15]
MPRLRRYTRLTLTVVIGLLMVAAATVALDFGEPRKEITAYFTGAVGVYPGSDVRVLGIDIGTIESVEPRGERVEVRMSIAADVPVPAEAGALVVTPSLVADRYIQLAPTYDEGPELADGDVIPVERTMVPLELDEIVESLHEFTTELGPDGANADGALSELLSSAATNLDGIGGEINTMIRELGKASRVLSGSEDDLFGTVDGLQRFTAMLADNDDQVREFNEQLATVSEILADERDELAAALAELGTAMGEVERFVKDNRQLVADNVDNLLATAEVLAKQRDSLSEALNEAPAALDRVTGAYDPEMGTLDTRANINEFSFAPPDDTPVLPLPPSATQGGDR